jgi:hypothetical protein
MKKRRPPIIDMRHAFTFFGVLLVGGLAGLTGVILLDG